jgi:hypothetical protein
MSTNKLVLNVIKIIEKKQQNYAVTNGEKNIKAIKRTSILRKNVKRMRDKNFPDSSCLKDDKETNGERCPPIWSN